MMNKVAFRENFLQKIENLNEADTLNLHNDF